MNCRDSARRSHLHILDRQLGVGGCSLLRGFRSEQHCQRARRHTRQHHRKSCPAQLFFFIGSRLNPELLMSSGCSSSPRVRSVTRPANCPARFRISMSMRRGMLRRGDDAVIVEDVAKRQDHGGRRTPIASAWKWAEQPLELAARPRINRANCRACSGLSLMPSSMTYSKVMLAHRL